MRVRANANIATRTNLTCNNNNRRREGRGWAAWWVSVSPPSESGTLLLNLTMHLRCCCCCVAADVMFVVVAVLIARRFSVSRVYLLLFLPHLRLVRLAAVVIAVFFGHCHLICIHICADIQTRTHTHSCAYTAYIFHLYFVTNWHCCLSQLFCYCLTHFWATPGNKNKKS